MKYISIALLVALVLVIAISILPRQKSAPDGGAAAGVPADIADRAAESGVAIVASLNTGAGEEPYTFVIDAENDFDMADGELRYTITGARVITREQDLPEGGFIPYYSTVAIEDDDGNVKYYTHVETSLGEEWAVGGDDDGDFILPDGSFMPGVCLVTIDVELESVGCRWHTVDEESEQKRGYFLDPYLFPTQSLFSLLPIWEGTDPKVSGGLPMSFYSGLGACYDPDSPDSQREGYNPNNYLLAVRLEPGETKVVTLGYLFQIKDGGPGLDGLCALSYQMDNKRNELAVYLGLGGNTEASE